VRAAGSLFGYELVSAFPLRRLLDAPGPRGRLELRRSAELPAATGESLVHAWTDAGVSFTLTRAANALRATCSVTGEFVVDGAAGLVHARPADGPDEAWEHRIVATAIPLLLAERGDVVLHAAAVDVGGRAVVVAGPPRRGKSTIAAAAASLGHGVVAEDGAAIELAPTGALLWPGPAGIRVRADVAEAFGLAGEGRGPGKRTLLVERPANGAAPLPVAAVALLAERAAMPSLTPIGPTAAVPLLVPNLIFGGSDRLADAFRAAARLVTFARVYRCRLPDGLARLPAALQRLLEALGSASAPSHAPRREPGDDAAGVLRRKPPERRAVAADGAFEPRARRNEDVAEVPEPGAPAEQGEPAEVRRGAHVERLDRP
jgi:hypothetical protein